MIRPLKSAGLNARFERAKPFPHIVIRNALNSSQAKALKKAVEEAPKKRLDTDLYQFWQTDDLKKSKDQVLAQFARWLGSLPTKDAVGRIAAIKVPGPVDISGFVYDDTDHLLPHDDRMPGRKVAFILYLTTSKNSDGGSLDLFETTQSGAPLSVKKRIFPKVGTLVLFRVSKRSYHQVAEVLSSRPRITIAGWFNG